MDPTMQTSIVIVAVACAMAFIIRRAIRVVRGEKCAGGCGSACSKQGAAGETQGLPLVSLNVPPSKPN